MRYCIVSIWLATVACIGFAQQTQAPQLAMPTQFGGSAWKAKPGGSEQGKLSDMFQDKVRAEWDAIQKKDKRAYAELLADDYEGVEVDGKGERTKIQTLNELAQSNVFTYTLWGFSLIPAGPDGALVIYEVTMEFPPKSGLRFSRVYISELWLKRNGEWKEVHYQETHVK